MSRQDYCNHFLTALHVLILAHYDPFTTWKPMWSFKIISQIMPHPALNFPMISHHVLNSTKVFPWPYKTLYDLAPGHFFDLIPFHSHPCLLLFTNTGLVPFEHAKLVLVFDLCTCCSLSVPLLMNLPGPLLSLSHRVDAQKIDTCWINEWIEFWYINKMEYSETVGRE